MLRTIAIAGLSCSLACFEKSASNPQAWSPPPLPNVAAQTIEDVSWCGPTVAAPGRDLGCGSWSLEHPAPQANDLHAVWAIAASNAWAVGDKGAIVHWAGEMNSPGVLKNAGWNKNTLKAGDQITVTLRPNKFGTPVGLLSRANMLVNGKPLKIGPEQ